MLKSFRSFALLGCTPVPLQRGFDATKGSGASSTRPKCASLLLLVPNCPCGWHIPALRAAILGFSKQRSVPAVLCWARGAGAQLRARPEGNKRVGAAPFGGSPPGTTKLLARLRPGQGLGRGGSSWHSSSAHGAAPPGALGKQSCTCVAAPEPTLAGGSEGSGGLAG